MADRSDIKVRFLGDDSQISRVFGRVSAASERTNGKLSRAGKTLGKVGAIAGGAMAAGVLAGGAALWKAGEAAADDAKGQNVLAGILKRTNGATKAQVAATEDWISKQSLATGVADDELRPALGKLLNAGIKSADAQKQLALAQDISTASGKDLATVTAAMAKGAMGSTGALSKLGLKTKDAAGKALSYDKILKGAAKTMGGAAASAAETTAGKMQRLKVRFGELQETVGGGVINAMDGVASVFAQKVMPVLERAGAKVVPVLQRVFKNDLLPALRTVGAFVTGTVFPAFKFLAGIIVDTVIPAVTRIAGAVLGGLKSAFASVQAAIERNRPGLEKLGVIFAGLAKFIASTLAPVLSFVLGNAFKMIGKILGDVLIPGVSALGSIFTWLWNKVIAPVTKFMLNAFAGVATFYATMLRGLSKVPGFGWAKSAADKLDAAAGKARSLAAGVKSIPSSKTVKVTYREKHIVTTEKSSGGGVNKQGGKTKFASGGRPDVGKVVTVGENGPELFIADTPGMVVDAATTRQMVRGARSGGRGSVGVGGGGGVTQVVHITINGAVDKLGTARQIRDLLSVLSRTEGVPMTFGASR